MPANTDTKQEAELPIEEEIPSTTPKQTMAVMAVSSAQMIAAIAPRYQELSTVIEARFDLMLSHTRQLAYAVSEMNPMFLGRAANTLQVLVDELKTKAMVMIDQQQAETRRQQAEQAAKVAEAARPASANGGAEIPTTGA